MFFILLKTHSSNKKTDWKKLFCTHRTRDLHQEYSMLSKQLSFFFKRVKICTYIIKEDTRMENKHLEIYLSTVIGNTNVTHSEYVLQRPSKKTDHARCRRKSGAPRILYVPSRNAKQCHHCRTGFDSFYTIKVPHRTQSFPSVFAHLHTSTGTRLFLALCVMTRDGHSQTPTS